ncbi:MAG TPA: YheC/YheD family protein [Desulfobacteria bacterium]|nr:YheC/YheD family protein [Desulfobacteria bacterium]
MVQSCQVYEADGQGMIWEVSSTLLKALHLQEDRLVTLTCGSLSAQLDVVVAQSSIGTKSFMGLSGKALAALKIPQNIYLTIKPIGPEQFRLGPVVGILTFPHVINKTQLNRYINYAEGMKKTGLLYVFRPFDIHPEIQTAEGFRYNEENKTWESGEFPYPDVVMDRMYPNDSKTHFELEKVIGPNKIFNKKTLIDKAEFNEVLEKDSYLQNFIPETKLFLDAKDLDYYLSKYNGVFLKPVDAMRGIGIIYVTAEGNESLCRYMDGSTVVLKRIPGADYIFEILGRVNEYKRPYIIQAAVNRMEYMKRPFSFRIMTTKNDSGNWSVPIIIAKAARPGAFLTNVSSGAEYVTIKEILEWIEKQLLDENIDFICQLTDLSLKAATALDNEFGPLGKLGIDIVIDASGKPWLIEANGNPGVIYIRGQKEFPDWHKQMYEHPLGYALYLAGFSTMV